MSDKKTIAEMITKNIAAEAEAREEYLPLIEALMDAGDKEGADLIREIFAEENKHAIILEAMLFKYDGNIPTEKSHALEALDFLKAHMSD